MSESRIVNTAVNTAYNFGVKLVSFFVKFLLRTVFIYTLGIEYVGVSGLFTDILSILSFVELGIGSAITYSLYKPIAEKDKIKIGQLMQFYKWAYRGVAIIILVLGMACVPFLSVIVKDVPNIQENIVAIYVLYLTNTVCSYLLVYKSTLLSANQKEFEISKISIVISSVKCVVESILLIVFKNFILYLCIEIFLSITQNMTIARKTNKLYPEVFIKQKERLKRSELIKLTKDIKALFLYKVSGVVLNGTDSVIISAFLGTGVVGILANYNLIVKNVYRLVLQVFTSSSASVGNLAATEGKEKQYAVFNAMQFMSFWIFGFCVVELFVNLNPFVQIWAGKKNILPMGSVILLLLDFYLTGMMSAVSHFRTSNGLFVQGQYRPLIMSIINLVVSLLLVKDLGIFGVLFGTVFSRLCTQTWYDPYLIYTRVFDKSVFLYWRDMAIYTGITFGISFMCIKLGGLIILDNVLVKIILNVIISAIIFNGVCILFFRKRTEFCYLKNIAMRLMKMIKLER